MAHRQINFNTPINDNGTLKLINVSGFKINDNMALCNMTELLNKGIIKNTQKWWLCYKIKDLVFWKAGDFKTREEALNNAPDLEIKVLHYLAVKLNEIKLIKQINEMEFYHEWNYLQQKNT